MFFIKNANADDIELGAVTEGITTRDPIPASQSSPQGGIASFLPLIIICVVFYFFIIRPQSKKQKEHQNLIENLKKGDKVVFANGMIGTIVKIEDEKYLQAEIAQNVKVRFLRNAVADIILSDKQKDVKNTEKKEIEEKTDHVNSNDE